jgi:hypothetical protein
MYAHEYALKEMYVADLEERRREAADERRANALVRALLRRGRKVLPTVAAFCLWWRGPNSDENRCFKDEARVQTRRDGHENGHPAALFLSGAHVRERSSPRARPTPWRGPRGGSRASPAGVAPSCR